METGEFNVIQFKEEYEQIWDEFVMNKSVNGTFLQTRRFLNYHPKERFLDNSYMVMNSKEKIVAVVPACLKREDGKLILYSHAGSTYGGVIISSKFYKVVKIIEILNTLEACWQRQGVEKIILKQTPSILSSQNADLFQYVYYYLNYQCNNELNFYIDYKDYDEDILSEFAQGKRTNVNNCIKQGYSFRKLESRRDVEQFVDLLSLTLSKYDKFPIHNSEEILEFQSQRLKEECECFGLFDGEKMIAGSMMFYFNTVRVAHTQYLCADPEYNRWSPMTYMYYLMIREMKRRGFCKLTWGIGTEQDGKYLNVGLSKSKESFGSKHSVNLTYIKKLV